jgi:hypothetical protein
MAIFPLSAECILTGICVNPCSIQHAHKDRLQRAEYSVENKHIFYSLLLALEACIIFEYNVGLSGSEFPSHSQLQIQRGEGKIGDDA